MNNSPNNITLIGLPGCGKSTIGRELFKSTSLLLIDTDKEIEKIVGTTLQELIQIKGNEYFKTIEEQVIVGIPDSTKNAIISTGGSVIYSEVSMKKLKDISNVIYLYTDTEKIIERINKTPDRGIILEEGYTLNETLERRLSLYEKYCDIKINTTEHTVQETIIKLSTLFNLSYNSL